MREYFLVGSSDFLKSCCEQRLQATAGVLIGNNIFKYF